MANHSSYSCLEKPMDRGAWQAIVHKVTKNQTLLKRLNMHNHYSTSILVTFAFEDLKYFIIDHLYKLSLFLS